MSAPFILVVDDEPDIRSLVSEILEDENYRVGTAEDGLSAKRALRDRRPDLVLLDIWMPDLDGISLLKEWSEGDGLPCPVVMMSGHGTVETAVEATRYGAYDFLEKPLSLAKLLLTVERALEADRLAQENVGLKRQVQHVIEPMGHSAVMQRLREQVKRVAQHDSWVLISGEPGSGRETFARYLHASSSRRDRPFVDVGSSAIVSGNAARELFGSETDGHIQYGRLEQASGGRCSSMRWRNWTWMPRRNWWRHWTRVPSCGSVAPTRSRSTSASLPPRSAICRPRSRRAPFARIFFTS